MPTPERFDEVSGSAANRRVASLGVTWTHNLTIGPSVLTGWGSIRARELEVSARTSRNGGCTFRLCLVEPILLVELGCGIMLFSLSTCTVRDLERRTLAYLPVSIFPAAEPVVLSLYGCEKSGGRLVFSTGVAGRNSNGDQVGSCQPRILRRLGNPHAHVRGWWKFQ